MGAGISKPFQQGLEPGVSQKRLAQPAGRLFGRKPVAKRLAAVDALRLAGTPAAIGTLQGLANDGDKQVRAAAVAALNSLRSREAPSA